MTSVCATLTFLIFLPAVLSKCLISRPEIRYKKHFFYHGHSLPIVVETSDRLSHQITSHILKILLEEVVGYENVQIEEQDSTNTITVMDRIAGCEPSRCRYLPDNASPKTMVDLEVWMAAGFSKAPWTETGLLVDAGPLGPYGRHGWFLPTFVVDALWEDGIIADHWRSLFMHKVRQKFSLKGQMRVLVNLTRENGKHICDTSDCIRGIFYGPGCSPTGNYTCAMLLASYPEADMGVLKSQVLRLNLPVNIAWIGQNLIHYVQNRMNARLPVMFFSWQPNVLTAKHNYTHVKFPMCQTGLGNVPDTCNFDVKQLSKVVWSKLKQNIPDVFHVIAHMTFGQRQYENLLQSYQSHHGVYTVACEWVQQNSRKWEKWIPDNLSNKTKIYLGGLFPLSGPYWIQPGLVQGAELALELINQNQEILQEYSLELIVSDSQCLPDVAMKAFIKYITNTTIPIVGILGPACSDEAEPIAALAKHFNIAIVTYGAEASSLGDRNKYRYFYRTIPQINPHRFVYEKFFKALKWDRVGAIAEGGQGYPEYHQLLQEHLQGEGISVIYKRTIDSGSHALDVSEIFAALRSKSVRVIIADFFVFSARAIMCEAYRQRMTAHEGYVWFLPSWYSTEWWDVDYYNSPPSRRDPRPQENVPCTTKQMEYAIEGHFVLSKSFFESDSKQVIGDITVGEYKRMYVTRVGKADVDGSPYATYVYDAVWVYALALNRLLKKQPSALESFHNQDTTQLFVKELNRTSFQGVSGQVTFEGSDSPRMLNIMQYFKNSSQLVGRYHPHSSLDGRLELYQSKINWLTPGGSRPTDGSPDEHLCSIERFRARFDVSCELAIVIANILGFGAFLFILILAVIFIKYRYDAKVRATHERMKELGLLSSDFSQCISLDEWEISREDVVLNRKLGEGAFGTVYGGEVKKAGEGWMAVAVKTLKIGSTVAEKLDFLSEADVMKSFKDPNIVQLCGVCTRGEPVYAIMEFLLHGDLKTYLLSRRNLVGSDVKEAEDVSAQRLTQMGSDVAMGLDYIHSKKLVHRDLACRNCLVHSSGTVKIGDFGMTKKTSESDYYRFNKKGMLPVRWMSPESLWDGLFTSRSDIWSYGVLIYEIVTFGSFPYQGLSNNQVLEFVKNGNKLMLPHNCPEELCSFIDSCMSFDAAERPDLQDVIDQLMKSVEFLKPCLDAPTTSVIIEDTDSLDFLQASCQNTITQSSNIPFLNRRSLNGSSQEKLKRWSGSQGMKVTPQKTTIKTFVPSLLGRPRSNSIGTPQGVAKDKYSAFLQEIQCGSPKGMRKDKTNRHSHEIPRPNSYHRYLPLLTQGERSDKGDNSNSSDYFSDNSKEVCQTVTSV